MAQIGKAVGAGRGGGGGPVPEHLSDPLKVSDDAGKPLSRAQNAALARIRYLRKTGQPVDLSQFHKNTVAALKRKYYIDASGKVIIKYPKTRAQYQARRRTEKLFSQMPSQAPRSGTLSQVNFADLLAQVKKL